MARVRCGWLAGWLVLLAMVGCAGGWHELRTQRITGYAQRPRAFREVMRQLEYSYAALSSFFPRAGSVPVEVLFLDMNDLAHTFGVQRGGLVFPSVPGAGRLGQRNLLVMHEDVRNGISTALLSHLFLHAVAPNAPLWLHEGMAHYLRSLSVQQGEDRWRACFGFPPPSNFRIFQMPLERFFGLSWTEYAGEASFYAGTSMLLMDFIFHGDGGAHLAQVPGLFAGASQGRSGPEIMAELFPGVTLTQLGRQISDFRGSQREQRGRGIMCPLPLPIERARLPDESTPRQSPIAPQEVEQLLAALKKLPHGALLPMWHPPELLKRP